MSIKHIAFDFGGVIFKLDRPRAVKRFVEIGIKDADERLDAFSQRGVFKELELGQIDVPDFHREIERLAGRSLTYEEVEHCWLGFVGEVPQYKLDFLEQLRTTGFGVHILSNTNPYVWGWGNSARFSASGRGISDYVDQTFASYKIGYMKPDARFFQYMLNTLKAPASECLFVDDGAANIAAAEKLGFHTLLVENGGDFRAPILDMVK